MTKEEIYDNELAPLMERILTICKDNRIAMIADFALDADDFHCTSAILEDDCAPLPNQLAAWKILKPQRAIALAETIETLPDGSKKITIRRIC